MAKNRDDFKEVLSGKKLPLLTLDNKWHQIFTQHCKDKEMNKMVKQINELVARQGGLNSDIKDIRKLKAKLMEEVVSGMDGKTLSDKEMEDHKRLIEECNEKIEAYQDELLDLPKEIDQLNYQLMLYTMEYCYNLIASNTEEIAKIGEWISNIRVELKKNVIRKQEKEWLNQEIYTYMHNIFGAEVIDVFDMKYDPSGEMLKKASDKKEG